MEYLHASLKKMTLVQQLSFYLAYFRTRMWRWFQNRFCRLLDCLLHRNNCVSVEVGDVQICNS